MSKHDVTLRIPGDQEGHSACLYLDGEHVAGTTGVTITHRVREIPRVTVDLGVHEVDFHGKAEVFIHERARETLLKFGWTPPPDEQ
jgi:hypothetical protein